MIKHEVSAGGIVYKQVKSIEWLICQHSQHKGWVFPKGLVGDKKISNIKNQKSKIKKQERENLKDAALREVKEEGGVKAKIVAKLPKPVEYFYKFKGQLIKKTVYYYLMKYVSGDPKNHDWEMSQAKFLAEDEVKKTLTYKSDKEAFGEALTILNSSS